MNVCFSRKRVMSVPLENAASTLKSSILSTSICNQRSRSDISENLADRVNCAGTGSGTCWNLIGRVKVAGSRGWHVGGSE